MPDGRFDFVIMGFHKAALPRDLHTAWVFLTAGQRAEQITEAYMRAIQKYRIDIVAHPGYGVPVNYAKLARACADYGVWFEINNKHGELAEQNLRDAAQAGVDFVVSSDAHRPEHVGLAQNALALAQSAGIPADKIVNVTEE